MKPSNNKQNKYLGYHSTDYETDYAKYYDETIVSVPEYVTNALKQSPYAVGRLPPLSKVTDLLKEGYVDVETGYSIEADGSLQVAALTPMPVLKFHCVSRVKPGLLSDDRSLIFFQIRWEHYLRKANASLFSVFLNQ